MGGRRRAKGKTPLANATNRQQAPRSQPAKPSAAALQPVEGDTQTSDDVQQLESDYASFARAKAKLQQGLESSSSLLGAASERSTQPPDAGQLRQSNTAVKERLRLALAAAKKSQESERQSQEEKRRLLGVIRELSGEAAQLAREVHRTLEHTASASPVVAASAAAPAASPTPAALPPPAGEAGAEAQEVHPRAEAQLLNDSALPAAVAAAPPPFPLVAMPALMATPEPKAEASLLVAAETAPSRTAMECTLPSRTLSPGTACWPPASYAQELERSSPTSSQDGSAEYQALNWQLQAGMLSVCLREEGPASAGGCSSEALAEALASGAVLPASARPAAAEGPESLYFEAFSLLEEKWHGRPSRKGAVRSICSIQ